MQFIQSRFFLIFFTIAVLSAVALTHFHAPKPKYTLSVIAIFQNERPYLKEWIDFHLLLGTGHFYLFDNLSSDDPEAELRPYIEKGIVELYDWPFASQPGKESDWNRIQTAAYREGLALARATSQWVAILDVDEFLFPSSKESLPAFLQDYSDASGILVNWQVYGTGHVAQIPEGGLITETLLYRSDEQNIMNTYCKSIVRPERVKYCCDPHNVIYYPWYYAVDTDKVLYPWQFHKNRTVKTDRARINHYWSRDEHFFNHVKLKRSEQWGIAQENYILRNDQANQVLDPLLAPLAQKIREQQKSTL